MALDLVPLATLDIVLRDPIVVGEGPAGNRMIFEVESARVTGDRIAGKLKGWAAADWLVVNGTVGTLDVRAAIETDDGAIVFAQYRGEVPDEHRDLLARELRKRSTEEVFLRHGTSRAGNGEHLPFWDAAHDFTGVGRVPEREASRSGTRDTPSTALDAARYVRKGSAEVRTCGADQVRRSTVRGRPTVHAWSDWP
jgi:hypothetical protein